VFFAEAERFTPRIELDTFAQKAELSRVKVKRDRFGQPEATENVTTVELCLVSRRRSYQGGEIIGVEAAEEAIHSLSLLT
jgi:hypothetical protein